ncbi:sensor histidine kinase [Streptomyces alfalfae]|nr:sensor histidine kinase [Streptomyces fradiae]RXX42795.1 sensor histidine kinase [Streptomyces alfalfae]RZM86378.1 sensor histidine kinase [Streptomyces alfalfae]
MCHGKFVATQETPGGTGVAFQSVASATLPPMTPVEDVMTDLVQAATVLPSVLTLAAGGAAWRFRGQRRGERAENDRLRRHAEEIAAQQRAAEDVLAQLAGGVLPRLGAEAERSGTGRGADIDLPDVLVGTVLAQRLTELANSAAHTVRKVQYDAQTSTGSQLTEVQETARKQVEGARRAAEESSRAAVRAVSSAMVGMASKLSQRVSQGVRRHEGDEAYETLVGIDHPTQQMLLVAQNYVVLSGGKLSRRWPATPMTDVVRAAMGSIEEYERVEHQELTVTVTSRAVGPVVHALAVLLDNAVRYSPASSRVHVAFQEGHHGVSVIVDDAGLRMNEEQLTWARQILTGERRDDVNRLGAHPQTGLRAAAALAGDYGFRIDLEAPNPFGGTRVYMFIPKSLLTTSPAPRTAPPPAVEPEPARRTTASGLTVRSRKTPAAGGRTPAAAPESPAPGRPSVAAAWARGTRSARTEDPNTTHEGALP